MTAESMLVEYKEARRLVEKRNARQNWFRHLLVYIIVNAAAVPINLTVADAYTWYYFPLIFWGIGLLIHLINGVLRFDSSFSKQERQIQNMLNSLEQP
jgi:hypothetical protein